MNEANEMPLSLSTGKKIDIAKNPGFLEILSFRYEDHILWENTCNVWGLVPDGLHSFVLEWSEQSSYTHEQGVCRARHIANTPNSLPKT